MRFFDCNVFFGSPTQCPLLPVQTVDTLLAEMDRAGIERALVWHILQHDASPVVGNQILADAIRFHPRLLGCWTVLPNQALELPSPTELFRQMKAAGIAALRIFPGSHHFLANRVSMGELLEQMVDRRIPLFISVRRGMDWTDVYALLSDFPDLTCVICDHGCWGMDRLFRPLLERYPRVYVDTAQYFLDGGLESLVKDYGAERLLFGSGFPESYFGGMMLALQHAEIPEEAKTAIACGNIERIISEERL